MESIIYGDYKSVKISKKASENSTPLNQDSLKISTGKSQGNYITTQNGFNTKYQSAFHARKYNTITSERIPRVENITQ